MPWEIVYQQTQRWLKAGVFEDMMHDLRVLVRICEGKKPVPMRIVDSRTLQSTLESGAFAGYDGAKKAQGQQIASGRRHAGQPAGAVRHPCH
jgi:hypothetical protein